MVVGTWWLNNAGDPKRASVEQVGLNFARSVGIEGEDAAALAALRKLPAEKVAARLNIGNAEATPTYASAMLDGKVVTEFPADAFANGHFNRVSIMIGANNGDLGQTRAKTMQELFARFGPDKAKAQALYDPNKSGNVQQAARSVGAEITMIEPARFIARAFVNAGLAAYEYRFSYVAESRRNQISAAPHGSEVPFTFDTVAAHYGKNVTANDEKIARQVNAYWADFAKTGNPNGQGLPEWPAYSPGADRIMDFTNDGPVAKPDPWKERLDLVERLAARQK